MTTPALEPEPLSRALEPVLAEGIPAPTPALLDAWRQAHYAAQLASEVGKGWAIPLDDDSHTAFAWRDRALHGAPVAAPTPLHASLRIADLTLSLEDADGAPLADRPLAGATVADGLAWVRAAAERLAGPARQPTRPAPDLPPHPLAAGARFDPAPEPLAALARMLGQADTILRQVAGRLGGAGPPRCWPHHFDLAVLAPLAHGPGGALAASLGLGLAPPDDFAAGGYWYASPWTATPAARTIAPAALARGRWIARGEAAPIGVLPLDELSRLAAPAAAAALAGLMVAGVALARGLVQAQQTAT